MKHFLPFKDIKCSSCKGAHSIKTVGDNTVVSKMKAMILKKDRRSLNSKRSQYARIYGNGDLLLNLFVAQCPLCGSLVALGQILGRSAQKMVSFGG